MTKAAYLTLIFSISFSPAVQAQTSALACQYVASGGMKWEDEQWKSTRFRLEQPFFLSTENKRITEKSASEVMGSSSSCQIAFSKRSVCFDELGGYLIYDFDTKQGGRSEILGSTLAESDYRDTMSVSAFICQEM